MWMEILIQTITEMDHSFRNSPDKRQDPSESSNAFVLQAGSHSEGGLGEESVAARSTWMERRFW